jgi:hypothetical protein
VLHWYPTLVEVVIGEWMPSGNTLDQAQGLVRRLVGQMECCLREDHARHHGTILNGIVGRVFAVASINLDLFVHAFDIGAEA